MDVTYSSAIKENSPIFFFGAVVFVLFPGPGGLKRWMLGPKSQKGCSCGGGCLYTGLLVGGGVGGGVVTAYPPTAPVCPQRPSPDDQEAPGPQGGQAGGVLRGPTRRLPERRLARARAGPTGGSPPRNWPNAHLIGFCFPRVARLFGHPHPHMSKTQDLVFETHDARSGISPLFGRCA